MNSLAIKKRNTGCSLNTKIIDNLFKSYERLNYEPEYFDETNIIIKTPVEFIVSFVDAGHKLSLGELHRLWTPLKDVSEFTGIRNYIIISKYGFEENCFSVEGYSVRLESVNYINSIMKSNFTNKPLELLPHNHIAYKNLISMWEKERFASIVQATGTGKSYIITKALQEKKCKAVLICPTIYILNQFKELFISSNVDISNIEFMTYARLSRLSDIEIKALKPKLIIIDELHRAGAEKWGEAIKKLIDFNKTAKVLGTTATPIRYLDDRRNMVEELFNGNVANSLDLFESMARGILPIPKYIEALYDVSSDLTSLENEINRSSTSLRKKQELLNDIKKFKISWNGAKTVSNIIKKHFNRDIKKAIVFCKDVNHIKESEPLVREWFKESNIYDKINTYISYSTIGEVVDELEEFKKPINKGEINLLFSVDKVSEGVHIKDVSSVIFLRSTLSTNVLLQQIGRALAATNGTTPIILDLINNVEILESQNFYDAINKSIDDFAKKKIELNLLTNVAPRVDVNFSVIDETKDFVKFMEKTIESLNYTWDDFLDKAVECKTKTGWFPGPSTPNEDKQLVKWVARQRNLYTNNMLSEDRIAKLKAVNFIFSFNKEKWLVMYDRLLEYKKENNVDSFFRHIISDSTLSKWVQNQRRRKTLNQIEEDEYNLLLSLGVSFNTNDDLWNYYIDRIQNFYKDHGYRNPTESEDMELCIFCRVQRRRKSDGKLSQEKIDLLNNINFIWESSDNSIKFNQRLEQLKEYISIYGDTRVPSRFPDFNNLGEWVKLMRTKKRKGSLPQCKIDALNALGFCWNPKDDAADSLIDEIIQYTLAKKDSNNVVASKSLGDAMTRIRIKYTNNELSDEIIQKLESVGFDWNPVKNTWNKRLNQLKEYNEKFNTFKVSTKKDFSDADGLQAWLNRQRAIYKKGTYPIEKIKELESIGFSFDVKYPKL